jgi:hypothetical protein
MNTLLTYVCTIPQEGEPESLSSELVGEEDYMPSSDTGIPIMLTLGS